MKIGDNNKICNSVLAENSTIKEETKPKSWAEKHSILVGVISSFIVGFILLFHFWNNIVVWIEEIF